MGYVTVIAGALAAAAPIVAPIIPHQYAWTATLAIGLLSNLYHLLQEPPK